jgi:branched-chain amino acid transport system substrate-binding protein
MNSIFYGEDLALLTWPTRNVINGHVITLQQLEDGNATGWDPADTNAAAAAATQNVNAVAYIGDFDSAATATSLPITNQAGLLQVSPASPYVGLTDPSRYDDKGEPERYRPSGTNTFARLVPTDLQEATATLSFMRDEGVKRVFAVTDTAPYASYDAVTATMVANGAQHAGIALAGSAQINSSSATAGAYAALAGTIAASGAQAVIVGGAPDSGIAALFQTIDDELPSVKLFAPSTLATNRFLDELGGAVGATYVTSPILPISQYGPQAKRILRQYHQLWPIATAWSLYGYQAMHSVLEAIKAAGKHADDRAAVARAYFNLPRQDSVIGGYRIESSGDTTRARFVGYQVEETIHGAQLYEVRKFLRG